nr:carboxypeptidase regulatory-like domain-containing protein [Acidobacteriota bacterium]
MKNLYGGLTLSVVVCLILFAACAATSFAQDLDDVTISGRVVDSNNAPIVGASVTATLVTTNVERTFVTDDEGRYRIIELIPGTYKVKVLATGFGAKEKIDLQTISGQSVQLDFSLAPA